ncbi:hypothetical protein [Variovorax sp. 54]|nr:hypothetical protein [Variovorax sp. 54]
MFDFDCLETATLHGWHRSFCLGLFAREAMPTTPPRLIGINSTCLP